MSREIKFRAWNEEEKEMLPVVQWDKYEGVLVGECFRWQHDNCELMQYTGLKDKNGREIYEGDIVKCYGDYARDDPAYGFYEPINEIKFNEASFDIYKNDEYIDDLSQEALNGRVEVIGNIYENPELVG